MNLIKIEEIDYGFDYETTPSKGESYINPEFITCVEKRHKRLGEGKDAYVHIIHMSKGYDFHVSKECYERITGQFARGGCPVKPVIEGERPKKPEVNPGQPIKQMF